MNSRSEKSKSLDWGGGGGGRPDRPTGQRRGGPCRAPLPAHGQGRRSCRLRLLRQEKKTREAEEKGAVRIAAMVHDPKSGRVMEILTNQAGIQFYSGNFLEGDPSGHRMAFCLETQCYPDSPNQPEFPSCILKPGETYHHSQVFRFSTK